MIRILLADDHKILRQGLRALLESEKDFTVVGEASNGIEAAEKAMDLHPDVLIADLRMPGLNGIETISKVREISPQTRTIILSMYSDDAYIKSAFFYGAKGYVLKDSSFDELVKAVREAILGKCFISAAINYKG